MKPAYWIFLLVIVSLAIFSCTKNKRTSDSHESYVKETSECDIKIVYALPDTNYTVLGQCYVADYISIDASNKKKYNRSLQSLKNCGCRKGGNAIVIVKSDTYVTNQDPAEVKKLKEMENFPRVGVIAQFSANDRSIYSREQNLAVKFRGYVVFMED